MDVHSEDESDQQTRNGAADIVIATAIQRGLSAAVRTDATWAPYYVWAAKDAVWAPWRAAPDDNRCRQRSTKVRSKVPAEDLHVHAKKLKPRWPQIVAQDEVWNKTS